MTTPFGEIARLDPPVSWNGQTWGIAIELASPEDDAGDRSIVSATIAAVSETETGDWWCDLTRESLTASRVITYEGGDVVEVTFPVLCGGNVIARHEAAQGSISRFESSAVLGGSRWSNRVLVGDRAVISSSGAEHSFEVVDVGQWEPDLVAWQGDDPVGAVLYFTFNGCDVSLFDEGRHAILFGATAEAPWDDGSVAASPDGSAWTELDRIVFDEIEDYFPPDASFGEYEFHYDSYSRRLRFDTTSMVINSFDRVRARYWLETDQPWQTIIEGEGCAGCDATDGVGFSDSGDSFIAAFAELPTGDFDLEFDVVSATDNCAVLVRFGLEGASADDAETYALILAVTGLPANHIAERTSDGGTLALSGSAVAYDLPFQVRVVRSGDTLTIGHRQDSGDAWDDETFTVPTWGCSVGCSAWIGGQVRLDGFPLGAFAMVPVGGAIGWWYIRRTALFEALTWFQTYTLPGSEAVAIVDNLTTGEPMVLVGSDHARDTYGLSGRSLTIYSESQGDAIRVTLAAPATAPDPPGDAPTPVDQAHWATQDSTDTDENRAHWGDKVLLRGGFGRAPAVGETIEFRRDTFAPIDAILAEHEFDTFGTAGALWETIPADDVAFFPAQGWVLLSEGFLDSFAANRFPCFRFQVEGAP